MASFPSAIVAFVKKFDLTNIVFAAHINDLQDELTAVEQVLGTGVAGVTSTATARLSIIEANLASIQAKFDGTGNLPEASVTGLLTDLANLQAEITALTTATTGTSSSNYASLSTEITNEQVNRVSAINGVQAQLNTLNAAVNNLLTNWTTWTPVLLGATTNPGISHTDCAYLVVGKTVHVRFNITLSSAGVGAYSFVLPFTPKGIQAWSGLYSTTGAMYEIQFLNRGTNSTTVDLFTSYGVSLAPNSYGTSNNVLAFTAVLETP